VPLLPKDKSLSAQGLLQCTSALYYECFHSNGGATDIKVIQNFGAGAIQLSFLSPRTDSLDEV
jgi:hypothetical protein